MNVKTIGKMIVPCSVLPRFQISFYLHATGCSNSIFHSQDVDELDQCGTYGLSSQSSRVYSLSPKIEVVLVSPEIDFFLLWPTIYKRILIFIIYN